jgi:hypothetical protein
MALACRQSPPPDRAATDSSAATASELSEADIQGAEYRVTFVDVVTERVRFTDRVYVDSTSRTTIRMVQTLGGDLDGDGNGDGVAILAANYGGTGTFVSVVPVLNRGGRAVPGKQAPLGDRVVLRALSLNADTLSIEMLAHSPADPMCCPSDTVTQRFHLLGDSLALLP